MFDVEIVEGEVFLLKTDGETFHLEGRQGTYDGKRLLLPTGNRKSILVF